MRRGPNGQNSNMAVRQTWVEKRKRLFAYMLTHLYTHTHTHLSRQLDSSTSPVRLQATATAKAADRRAWRRLRQIPHPWTPMSPGMCMCRRVINIASNTARAESSGVEGCCNIP